MNMVIATGCSCSGWEVVLPTLEGAGLENDSQAVSQWHEQMLASSGVSNALELRQSLRPDSRMEDLLASLLPGRPAMPVCVADSCSLWLLDFWATKYPDANFLLFFCRAETAVASALISGINPARFVEGWKAASRHMMQFQRRHRGRALLLNAEVASRHPHAFIAASRLAGVSLQLPTDWAKPQEVIFPAMARFLAKRIVANDPSLAALQLELEARAQPVGGSTAEDSTVGLDDLVKCYLEWLQDRQRVGSELRQSRVEFEKLFLDKQDLERTLQTTQAELQQLRDRLREVDDTRTKLETANLALAASGKGAQKENELLLKQLHEVQEELEHYFIKYQETLVREESTGSEKAPAASGIPAPEDGSPPAVEQRRPDNSWKSHTLIRGLVKPFKRRDRAKERIRRQVDVLDKSGLFDEAWYLSTYPDVASAGANPTEHYLRFGAAEGRNPSPAFDTVYYLQSNPDVAVAGVNPLLHYIEFGISEGRQPCSGKARF